MSGPAVYAAPDYGAAATAPPTAAYGAPPPPGYGGPPPAGYPAAGGPPVAAYGAPPPAGYGPMPGPGYAVAAASAAAAGPVMMGPGGVPVMMAAPVMVATVPTGWQLLEGVGQFKVKQKLDLVEVLTGCEMRNKYRVLRVLPDGRDEDILYMKEQSTCMQRQCCGSMREFEVDVTSVSDGALITRMRRPFKCTCLCLNRPELGVFDARDARMGTVHNPWACCRYDFVVHDDASRPVYSISGEVCQAGFFCRCPCGPCARIVFTITRAGTGEVIGEIARVWSGLAKEILSNADNFTVSVPPTMPVADKAMLLSAVILIDFVLFEQKEQNHHHHHHSSG